MKTQFKVVVTLENEEQTREVSTLLATEALNSFIRVKNQHGCKVSENKITFSVASGPVEIN